ncbi:MAG: YkgJ family cysteine cluster protein [Pseudomonadota bacterium]|nr:YkgJ family cysteine cluster protein [Pseudomonadota bacterium]
MLSAEEQAAFDESARRVQRSVVGHLRRKPGIDDNIAFVGHLQRSVDRVVASSAADGARIDCAKGCSHCCSVRVQAMAPEVFRIADELRRLSPAALAAINDRLRAHVEAVGSKSVAEHRAPCPFLDDDVCSIYALRPAVCRKGHSADVQACREALPQIPQHLRIVVESEALMSGTAAAYAEVGLAAGRHELGQAVLMALTDPQARHRWAAGATVFDAPPGGAPTA